MPEYIVKQLREVPPLFEVALTVYWPSEKRFVQTGSDKQTAKTAAAAAAAEWSAGRRD